MKTIEEKAKAYDELIPKLKEWHDGLQDRSPAKDTLELILPQFRESEDERIRKCICMALTDVDEQRFKDFGTTLKDCLAYLERQKEQKPISSCDIVPYIDDAIAALQDMWREEKVAFDWDDMHEMIEDVAHHFYHKEPKPVEWSEEDERILTGIIERGSVQVPPYTTALREEQIEWLMNRLKSLRPQPKQEWSEEEKDNISILLCMIDSMDSISLPSGTLRISGEKRRELKEFIKRPSWKLTEDQIYTLERICSNLHLRASDDAPKLDEIIEQLKQK